MRKKIVILLLISIILLFSGCSVTELNDMLKGEEPKDKVMQVEDQVGFGTIVEESESEAESEISESNVSESSISEEETDPEIQKKDAMNVLIKSVGESHTGYVIYDEKIDDEIVRTVRGTEGVTYTLNSVTVYESLEESGITLNESILEPDGELNIYTIKRDEIAEFIVADMSATYVAPKDGENPAIVHTSSDFFIDYFTEDLKEGFEERRRVGEITNNPVYTWFEVDEEHRVNRGKGYGKDAYNFYINDGETVNFKVGIFSPKELIDTKNIYICVNWFPPAYFTNDYSHKYFAIYPEE